MSNSLVNQSRTSVLELHLSTRPAHSFPGALENLDFATLRMKRKVKDGESLLLLHWDGSLCYLQGLPTPGAAATPWGSSCWRAKARPVSQGTGRAKTGGEPKVVSLLLTAWYPVWPCYLEPERREWGQSFRGWFSVQTMTKDGPSTAKTLRKAEHLCIHTVRDIHMRLSQTPRPWLNVPSVCHLSTWNHGQHGPDESTFVQVGHVDNFGPLFKLGLLLKSVVSHLIPYYSTLRTPLKVEALYFLKFRDIRVCLSFTKNTHLSEKLHCNMGSGAEKSFKTKPRKLNFHHSWSIYFPWY